MDENAGRFDAYLGPSEAARRLGIAPVTLRVWFKRGKVPFVWTPIGRLVAASDVERIVRERDGTLGA